MEELSACLKKVREQSPLTLCLTNEVTINDCANALLAVGASPVMSGDAADAEALAALASATVINTGTCNDYKLEIMLAAGRSAKKAGRPVLLDPVGVGATEVRRKICGRIIEDIRPDIIRGNFSEIQALAGLSTEQKGVDSVANQDADSAAHLARDLSARLGAVVAVSGAVDVISDGRSVIFIAGGSPLMTKVTGTGCLLSAVMGAYAGADPGRNLTAAAAAMSHLALAGEMAAEASSPAGALGSFRVALFDHLSLITEEDLANKKGVSRHD